MNKYSEKYTESFINNMKQKDINVICFLYLESKAFKDNTIIFLKNRWDNFSDNDIIVDLLLNKTGYTVYGFPDNKQYSSLYWIINYNCIDIIPLHIIQKLPINIWNELILDTYNSTDMSKYRKKTFKEFLLDKRKTPKEIKEYLNNI